MHYLGLISGTSADGIDAALMRFEPTLSAVATHTFAYPPGLRRRLLPLIHGAEIAAVDEIACLDAEVGLVFAQAASILLQGSGVGLEQVRAIGSHGQTIRHRPRNDPAFTWQIGDPSRIVERTGITTVADFRRRDMAAGGQGAPLVPAFHASIFGGGDESRAVLNLGGIANLSLLPKDGPVLGFDTGPANALMDLWAQRCGIGEQDEGGQLASQGEVDRALLEQMLSEPWFDLPPPKSSGREDFNAAWLDTHLGTDERKPADVMATLLALTVETVARALQRNLADCKRLLVCGGGSCNPHLMSALQQRFPSIPVESTLVHGLDPNFVEAAAFAWLAQRALDGQPGNLPAVTGAKGLRVLGAIYPA